MTSRMLTQPSLTPSRASMIGARPRSIPTNKPRRRFGPGDGDIAKHHGPKLIACAAALKDLDLQSVSVDGGTSGFPDAPGVYAIYDGDGSLQYIGLSRKISISIAYHARELPELAKSVKYQEVPGGDRESLTEAWKAWLMEHVDEAGAVPPGNVQGEQKWQPKKKKKMAVEIKLTPGKGIEDLSCSIEDLIDSAVKETKVLAIIKGTATEPQCGFSHKMLTLLNSQAVEYHYLNVLDEFYNPGLREAIKQYSQWPTIPQLYVQGDFVGGSDIVEEMVERGEMKKLFEGCK